MTKTIYAGFWIRSIAFLIDFVIIGVTFKKSFGWYMNYIGFGCFALFTLGLGIAALIDVVSDGDDLFWVLGLFAISAVFTAFVVLQWRCWRCWALNR